MLIHKILHQLARTVLEEKLWENMGVVGYRDNARHVPHLHDDEIAELLLVIIDIYKVLLGEKESQRFELDKLSTVADMRKIITRFTQSSRSRSGGMTSQELRDLFFDISQYGLNRYDPSYTEENIPEPTLETPQKLLNTLAGFAFKDDDASYKTLRETDTHFSDVPVVETTRNINGAKFDSRMPSLFRDSIKGIMGSVKAIVYPSKSPGSKAAASSEVVVAKVANPSLDVPRLYGISDVWMQAIGGELLTLPEIESALVKTSDNEDEEKVCRTILSKVIRRFFLNETLYFTGNESKSTVFAVIYSLISHASSLAIIPGQTVTTIVDQVKVLYLLSLLCLRCTLDQTSDRVNKAMLGIAQQYRLLYYVHKYCNGEAVGSADNLLTDTMRKKILGAQIGDCSNLSNEAIGAATLFSLVFNARHFVAKDPDPLFGFFQITKYLDIQFAKEYGMEILREEVLPILLKSQSTVSTPAAAARERGWFASGRQETAIERQIAQWQKIMDERMGVANPFPVMKQ